MMGVADISAQDAAACQALQWQEFEKMGIDPEKQPGEYNRFQRALYGWADFAEYWFKNPMDDDQPLHLDPPQRATINALQFGYDIDAYPWIIPANNRPKEIVMIWPRQFGKSTAVAVAAACAWIFMKRRFHIGTFSINEEGAMDLMSKIKIFIQQSPFSYLIDHSNTTEIVKIGEKVVCTAYPASEGVRGRAISLGLIDEAAKIPESILNGVILWTLRRVGQRWILLSTPAGYKGEFIRHFTIGMKTRPVVCGNITSISSNGRPVYCMATFEQVSPVMAPYESKFNTYTIPSNMPNCPICGGNRWFYGVGKYTIIPVDPWVCSWKTRDQIMEELMLAGNTPLARQEILGEIIMEGATIFTREMLERCTHPKLKNIPRCIDSIRNYTVGMDFGKVHDSSVIYVTHYDWHIHKCVWDYMETISAKYQGIDYHDIRDRFLDIVQLYNPTWIVPDATGVGDSVVDEMFYDLRDMRVKSKIYCNKDESRGMFTKKKRKGFILDIQSKPDIIENLAEGLTKRADILIPPYSIPEVKEFWDEMLGFSFEVTESKHVKYGTQKGHDDRVIAFALAYKVAKERPFIGVGTKLA